MLIYIYLIMMHFFHGVHVILLPMQYVDYYATVILSRMVLNA